jgi:hypothetical protein
MFLVDVVWVRPITLTFLELKGSEDKRTYYGIYGRITFIFLVSKRYVHVFVKECIPLQIPKLGVFH